MTSGRDQSPYGFEKDKPGTDARSEAEADIETLRQSGGLFTEAVARTRMPMAVADCRLPGNPIVFANEAFIRLSGYAMNEVLGQQPHFMNGPDTDPDDVARFREALRRGEDIVVDTWQYRKDGSPFYAAVFCSPIADEEGKVVQHFLSYLDITRRVEAEQKVREHAAELEERVEERTRSLAESEARYRTLFESIDTGFCVIEVIFDAAGMAVDYVFLDANPAFVVQTGLDDAVGKPVRSLIPDHEEFWFEVFGRIARTGLPRRFEHRADAIDRWYDVYATRVGEPHEHKVAVLFADIKARRRTEEHQRVLLAELQHRVRNTLAVVRSIARRTAQKSESVDEMSAHFEGRLDAFARVQAMVTRNPASGVDLAGMIEDELVAHAVREGESVTLDGPEVSLAARPAEALSLAIHELMTNAVKYGALSTPAGRIAIGWRRTDCDLALTWRESGGPGPVTVPQREGFGLELLRRALPYELKAEVELDFRPEGFRFSLSMPVDPAP